MTLRFSSFVTLAAAAAALAGCQRPLNGSISPGPDLLPIYAAPDAAAHAADGPSLTAGHDRSAWPMVTIDVPINQAEHRPIAELSPQYLQRTPRERGAFPTTDDAVTVTPNSLDHVCDAGMESIGALGAFAISPYRLFEGLSDFNARRSPNWAYERVPAKQVDDLDRWYTVREEGP